MNQVEATWGCVGSTPTVTQEVEERTRGAMPPEVMESIRSMVEGIDVCPTGQTVLLDIGTCDLKLSEVMAFIALAKQSFPLHEVFMDGDMYAIVARARGFSA